MSNKDDTILADERGFVLVGALLILLLLVLIGIAATSSTSLELQMAASHRARALAFYGGEAGVSFVQASPDLWGSANITEDTGLRFPSAASSETPEDPAARQTIGVNNDQSFQGTIIYKGSGPLPRSNDPTVINEESLNAHYYEIQSTGYGPNGAEVVVAMEAYRVGF